MWSAPTYRPFGSSHFGCIQQKRKTDPDMDIMPPNKMHITEEKMVSQLKGIHLSKDYTSHGVPTARDLEIEEAIESRLKHNGFPSLVVCDEIRALQNKVDSILPKALMEKFERPTTALVLWQPPAGDLGKGLSLAAQASNSNPQLNGDIEMNEEDDNNNNNGSVLASDVNTTSFVR